MNEHTNDIKLIGLKLWEFFKDLKGLQMRIIKILIVVIKSFEVGNIQELEACLLCNFQEAREMHEVVLGSVRIVVLSAHLEFVCGSKIVEFFAFEFY